MDCCCTPADHTHKPLKTGRVWTILQWFAAIGTFVLVPKCPACLASYFLLITGIGISLSLATTLRWGMIALAISAMAFLTLRLMQRLVRRAV